MGCGFGRGNWGAARQRGGGGVGVEGACLVDCDRDGDTVADTVTVTDTDRDTVTDTDTATGTDTVTDTDTATGTVTDTDRDTVTAIPTGLALSPVIPTGRAQRARGGIFPAQTGVSAEHHIPQGPRMFDEGWPLAKIAKNAKEVSCLAYSAFSARAPVRSPAEGDPSTPRGSTPLRSG